jgi:hypothetical protein
VRSVTPLHSLQTLQRQFQDDVLQDRSVLPGLLSARGAVQFGVYRNAYRARLRAALRDNYEVLPLVMGDAAFDALANAYIAEHPSRHYSLRWFGHQLSAFMAANVTWVDHPAMLDLARMEWALRTAFDAAPVPLLTTEELAGVPAEDWATLRFRLQPCVQLLGMQWAVGPIWHAVKSGQDDVQPPDALAHHIMVWRRGLKTQWRSLSAAEADFMHTLACGQNFGQACEALAEYVGADQAGAAAVALLGQLLHTDALCSLQTPVL